MARKKFDPDALTDRITSDRALTSEKEAMERFWMPQTGQGELELNIDSIHPDISQPRKSFPKGSLESMAKTIKSKGVLQPIIVYRAGTGANEFIIKSGERRWRAAQLAGLLTIPALIKDKYATDAEISLIENIQREDLHPVELSCHVLKIIEEKKYKHQELADLIGKDRTFISKCVKIADFVKNCGAIEELVNMKNLNGEPLAMEHFILAASQPTPLSGMALLKKISSEGLTANKIRSQQQSKGGWDSRKAVRFLRGVRKKTSTLDSLSSLPVNNVLIDEIEKTKKHFTECAEALAHILKSYRGEGTR